MIVTPWKIDECVKAIKHCRVRVDVSEPEPEPEKALFAVLLNNVENCEDFETACQTNTKQYSAVNCKTACEKWNHCWNPVDAQRSHLCK